MARRSAQRPPDEFDSPWKDAIERYFPAFLEFYFPAVYAGIDWSRGYEFLDKELRSLQRRTGRGPMAVDKLVRVWKKDGDEAWVLVHIEIQNQPVVGFPKRLHRYNYLILERCDREVVSLALLTDSHAAWRPSVHTFELWGFRLRMEFPVAKLLDYGERWDELERSTNPFAVVTMAHLKAQETRRRPRTRLQWKVRLIRGLYERGWSRENVVELFRFIDWVMALPEELEAVFEAEIEQIEEERKMPFISPYERRAAERGEKAGMERGMQRGLEQGMQQGLERGMQQGLERGMQQGLERGMLDGIRTALLDTLRHRFGPVDESIRRSIEETATADRLRELHRAALDAASLDAFREALSSDRAAS